MFRSPLALAAIVCAASPALAGPDVVVSGIGEGGAGIIKYGSTGGVTGYAITTVSCNIGDAAAIWLDYNNQHPVIGSQVYRLHGGRFEQIGMSWLKHGFCAADWPGCTDLVPGSVYQGNNTCETLGLFATDTYDAFLNGQQSNLGPRSEVDAVTGQFPFPPAIGWGSAGNCLFKRVQLANADLSPTGFPGARYFAEVHYITTDEAPADRANNASYRELAVGPLTNGSSGESCAASNRGYSLTFAAPIVPLRPAIEAWKAIDPAVTLVYVDLPGDGRIAVAAKATDLGAAGGGFWQYEYAVYNHNSDAAIGSVSIPFAAGAAITGVGFRDVPYHSGEPYSGTDWPGQVLPGRIDWATAPFATSANANAIRWSTTYNFRFQSSRAPSTGSITLGRFKPATPQTISVPGLPVPLPPPACPADFNMFGGVTVQDIFDYLSVYFAGRPTADFNSTGGVTLQDLFDFLGAYFTPCP